MPPDFLTRSSRELVIAGALAGALAASAGHLAFGAGVAAGAVWGAANLLALALFLRMEVGRRSRRRRRDRVFYLLAVLKFPVLYGAGFALLRWGRLPAEGLLAGFTLLFLMWTAQAVWTVIRQPMLYRKP